MVAAVVVLLVMILTALSGVGFSARAVNMRTGDKIQVAFAPIKGVSEIDENGKRTGILVDYLNEISKYTNWQYEYVDVPATDMTGRFMDGEFDLMGSTYYNAAWENYFAYPKYSMGNTHAMLIFRKDDPDIKNYDIESINGKRIGVYANATEKIRRLNVYLDANNLNCEIKTYTSDQMTAAGGNLFQYLRDGDVDALLGNDTDVHEDFSLFAMLDDQPYYIVTHPGQDDILQGLNFALEKILEINPNFAEEVYNKHVTDAETSYVRLSDAEIEYVKQNNTVRVSVVRDWHPFYCADDETISHRGILPDVLDRVSKFSGLTCEYVFVDTYADMIDAVLDGRADIVGCFDNSDDAAFEMGIARTSSYVSLSNTVVKNKSVNFPSDGLLGGVVRGSYFDNSQTDTEPVYFDSVKDGLEAVEKGEIDFFGGLSASIEKVFQAGNYSNITFVSNANTSVEISFALDRPVDTVLYAIVNKSLRSITSEEKTAIVNKNIVSESVTYRPTLSDMIASNPAVFALIIVAFFAIITGGVLIFVRYRYRSRIMQSELEKAEARSRAKSDFLSRMSHEIRTPMNAIVGLSDLLVTEPDLSSSAAEKVGKLRSSSDYLLALINDILDMSRIESGRLELATEDFSLGSILDEVDKMTEVLAGRKNIAIKPERALVHNAVHSDPVRLRQVLVNLISNAVKFTPEGGIVRMSATETRATETTATYEFAVCDNGVGIADKDKERIFRAFEQANSNMSKSNGTGLGLPISSHIVHIMGGELKVESEEGVGSKFYFEVTLPLCSEVKLEPVPTVSDTGSLNGIKVLLAEDNDINAEIACELLSFYGATAERAVNGREAVEMFTASESGTYDVILMDIKMPVMDGLEATESIRSSSHADAATVPIIAMTANSFVEDRLSAENAGMSGFVAKPVDLDELVATILTLLAKKQARGRDDRSET